MSVKPTFKALLACFLTIVAACGFSSRVYALAIPGMGTYESTMQPRDSDGDGQTDAYYDTQLNLTWLDYGRASLVWPAALNYVASLNVAGVTGWRMPRTYDPLCNLNGPVTNCGVFPIPTSSELAHLYYITLGHLGHLLPGNGGILNGGPFTSLSEDLRVYGLGEAWSETEGFYDFPVNSRFAWRFDFISGSQAPYGINSDLRMVFPVHDGDVFKTDSPPINVPEPGTLLLTAAALLGLVAARRKRGKMQA